MKAPSTAVNPFTPNIRMARPVALDATAKDTACSGLKNNKNTGDWYC